MRRNPKKPSGKISSVLCSFTMPAIFLFCGSAFDARAQYSIGQRVWTPPRTGTYFSLQSGGTNFPPTPFLPYDPIQVPVYALNGSTAWTNRWAALTTDTNSATLLLRGSLSIDEVGTFGGNLICVTGGDSGSDGGEVWTVTSAKAATRLTKIESLAPHLEGILTLTNSPWAGRILTGAESELPPVVYAIDTNAAITALDLAIEPEDFDLIQTNQDLYCLDQGDENIQPRLLKLSRTLLTNFWGQLLITQEGAQHLDPHVPKKEGRLFFVDWDASTTNFVTRRIKLNGFFEHVTFAPITLPNL
jgi:hypothetical protein